MHATENLIGLVMILSGVFLLIVFGLPFRVHMGRRSGPSTSTPKEIKIDRWYTFLGWLGLALIVLGTIAQLDASFSSKNVLGPTSAQRRVGALPGYGPYLG